MDKAKIQEILVTLYMRLNGYFTSGFIVHSPKKGRNLTEVDILAVRFPGNREPERQVHPAPELDPCTTATDIVIGEVKSKGGLLQFNQALTTSHESLASILRWVGVLDDEEIQQVAAELVRKLTGGGLEPARIEGPRATRVQALLFSPGRCSRQTGEPWYISGEQIFGFIFRCLSPAIARPGCSAVYDFGLWGYGQHAPHCPCRLCCTQCALASSWPPRCSAVVPPLRRPNGPKPIPRSNPPTAGRSKN